MYVHVCTSMYRYVLVCTDHVFDIVSGLLQHLRGAELAHRWANGERQCAQTLRPFPYPMPLRGSCSQYTGHSASVLTKGTMSLVSTQLHVPRRCPEPDDGDACQRR